MNIKPGIRKLIMIIAVLGMVLSFSACGKSTYKEIERLKDDELCLAFRYEDKLAATLSAALDEVVAAGVASRLAATYFGEDVITASGDSNAIVNLEELANERTLIMGIQIVGAPYAYVENGELTGFAPELARAVASELGWEITFQEITAADAKAQLGSGNIDCAVCVPLSLFPAEKYSVSDSIMKATYTLASQTGSTHKSLRSLKDEYVALVEGDAVSEKNLLALEEMEKFNIGVKYYKNASAAADALLKGDVKAAAMDEVLLGRALIR